MGSPGQKHIPVFYPQTEDEKKYEAKLHRDAAITVIETELERHKVDDLRDPKVHDTVVDLLDMLGVGPEYHALNLPQDVDDDLVAAAS